jgi:diguanylate cyclase (GGDEF)-like protein/PAS domain S-box-containing protein
MTTPPLNLTDSELLAVISQFASASISVYDTTLQYHFVNETFARIHGRTPEQLIGLKITDVEKPENLPLVLPNIRRALSGESIAYERRVTDHGGGFTGWRIISLVPWRNAKGKVIGVVNCGLSVNDLMSSTEELRIANQRLTSHMENSPLAVLEFDNKLNISYASPRAENLFGWLAGTGKGLPLKQLLGRENRGRNKLQTAFSQLQSGKETNNRVETTNVRSDGVTIHCEWFNSAITGDGGKVVSIMSLIQDVSDRIRLTEQLRSLAERDSLTGLLNRSAFQIQMELALGQTINPDQLAALLFIDLDGFKLINDTLGHGAGDLALKEVGKRISSVVRSKDIVARIGGDEFVVLLETGTDREVVDGVCARVIATVAAPLDFGDLAKSDFIPKLGASIGVVMFAPRGSQVDALLKRADDAMYEAKRAGKGCFRYAN